MIACLWKPIGQVKQIFWHSDRAEKLVLRDVIHIVIKVVHE